MRQSEGDGVPLNRPLANDSYRTLDMRWELKSATRREAGFVLAPAACGLETDAKEAA